ncbi:ribosome maturation factor RimP [Fannyhessea vaginae]|uniref:ribosome maturation factor RimP n=1 Tax=Fannyhessea vaginae TaxID=82135 RepID=UPI003A805A38
MSLEDIQTTLLKALEEAATPRGIDIVDVELAGTRTAPVIRLRIDHLDETLPTITLDEVAAQSEWINEVLDSLDPIDSSYTLEVSSPGLARPLRRIHDFERFRGQEVELVTRAQEGRKRFTGKLSSVADNTFTLIVDGQDMTFTIDDVKSCKIKPTF